VEIPRVLRHPAPRWVLVVGAATIVPAAICVPLVDRPVARELAHYQPSELWNRGITVLEWTIGLPIWPLVSSCVLVAAMIATSAVKRWRYYAPAWTFVAGCHIASRFLTTQLKDATGRLRPSEWLAHGQGATFWRDGIGFPSGHVVLFASLAIPIVVLAPRWWPLLALVVFAGAARVAVGAHFVSDTLAAITLVTLVTWAVGALVRPLRS
jgi:membrane-associated phospholipid phosphatase